MDDADLADARIEAFTADALHQEPTTVRTVKPIRMPPPPPACVDECVGPMCNDCGRHP